MIRHPRYAWPMGGMLPGFFAIGDNRASVRIEQRWTSGPTKPPRAPLWRKVLAFWQLPH
jgi:hypothetical protein